VTKKGTLLLLPNLLGEGLYPELYLPVSVQRAVESLEGLISESDKGGKLFLSLFKRTLPQMLFNKNTPDDHIDFTLEPILKGERWGYVSDAGLPCIADPGAKLVRRARELGLGVQAFTGPSSVTLGLMLSGIEAQSFCFHGYFPEGKSFLELQKMGRLCHIFIEAPYKNDFLLEKLIQGLPETADLCTAVNLTLPDQAVITQKVSIWRKVPRGSLKGKTALFLVKF
jgi:16S rRNA (cytidine1402-2'-O)-methyltransferase